MPDGMDMPRRVVFAERRDGMRTMHFSLSLALALVLFPAVLTAHGPNDVEGWRAARWGMTEAEVLEAFKGEARTLDKEARFDRGIATIEIPAFTVEANAYHVQFLFDTGGRRLKEIHLSDLRMGSSGPPAPARRSIVSASRNGGQRTA